jgi:uncharacterized tellurite resistance protein B-like protein
MRPREFIDVIEHPESPPYRARDEQSDMLRTLLVHLFFVDFDLDRGELDMLARLLPQGDLRAHVEQVAAHRLDLHKLAALFPDPVDRADIVTLAEHAVWSDGRLGPAERQLVARLGEVLGVSPSRAG